MSNPQTSNAFAPDDNLLDQNITETTAIVELADEQLEAVAGGQARGLELDPRLKPATGAVEGRPYDPHRDDNNLHDAGNWLRKLSRFVPRVVF
jgi:hypothetical protein